MATDLDTEISETLIFLRLTLRGIGLAFLAGLLWYWPLGPSIIAAILMILAGHIVIFLTLPLIVASAAIRGIAARSLGLEGHRRTMIAFSFASLGGLLLLAACAFLTGEQVYALIF